VKVRSPKSEVRRKSEVRSPKSEVRRLDSRTPAYGQVAQIKRSEPATCGLSAQACSGFGFRISAFFRTWDFGLRTLALAVSLLFVQPLFAATNSSSSDDIPSLRGPHAQIPPDFWEQYSGWVILGTALLLVLVCIAVWFLTRPRPPMLVPPEVEARQALEPLRQKPEDGALLSRVSQILRHYVVAAFGLPPEELTTAEFCRAVAGHERVGADLAAALADFLHQCDERKFSPPSPALPLSAVTQALHLIDQSQARLTASAQSATQPAGVSNPSPPKAAVQK
jgi:hypothetical protein